MVIYVRKRLPLQLMKAMMRGAIERVPKIRGWRDPVRMDVRPNAVVRSQFSFRVRPNMSVLPFNKFVTANSGTQRN